MREKELRLGVVLTGGISLAVYMHGVSKELLKLTRASRAYHDRNSDGGRIPDHYADGDYTSDTEPVYFELLKALSPEIDLRIIIDVIAGASAGGINGVLLARALAHDLDLEAHRDMWLKNADVLHLIDKKASAGRWGKIYIAPVVNFLMRGRLGKLAPEPETRRKLLIFLRSRWFKPPFSGVNFSKWLLDACAAMGRGKTADRSLLPEGHALDLFVTVTDFHGHFNRLSLHNPPEIEEIDHRHVLYFNYLKTPGGELKTDFDKDNIPGLVFAARATSCFPGAFPPATVDEMDRILAERGEGWPGRDVFVADKLAAIMPAGRKVEDIRLIDGSVVSDKPFGVAIAAIINRPAHREVSRRLLFVQPEANLKQSMDDAEAPGFFRTILSSLAEIPRNEPVHDDLARVEAFNKRMRLLGQVVRQCRPVVDPMVDAILPSGSDFKPTQEGVAGWRQQANEQAAQMSGYAFYGYFRLKNMTITRSLKRLTGSLGWPDAPKFPVEMQPIWAQTLAELGLGATELEAVAITEGGADPREIEFIKTFDVDFRVRRLRFVIRHLNDFYRLAAVDPELGAATHRLDELKTTLYTLLEEAKRRWDPEFYPSEIASALHVNEPEGLKVALAKIGDAMGLAALDGQIDEVFSVMVLNYIPKPLRRDLFAAYIGFAFFDVLSFPMMQWEDLDDFEEILIDRISPSDARAIRTGGGGEILRGTALRRFGGFFNRSYRENDYLWGRLNAADRLVDIVLGGVDETRAVQEIDAMALKAKLFLAILDAEEPHLKAERDLVSGIRQEVLVALGDGA